MARVNAASRRGETLLASKPNGIGPPLCIYKIEHGINDRVLAGYSGDTPYWSAIRYAADGEAYFMKYGQRQYLRDFIRIDPAPKRSPRRAARSEPER